jgi:hypothetical protein
MERITKLGVYSASCYCLHTLLQYHYVGACRGFFSFLSPTAYCQAVEACLHLLQLSPLLVTFPLLLKARSHTATFLEDISSADAAKKEKATKV